MNASAYLDKLRKRREVIETTLRHLEKEHHIVDENNDWLDYAAYESRVTLLDGLTDGYLKERLEIDSAITRIDEKNYALCACFVCKEMREEFAEV